MYRYTEEDRAIIATARKGNKDKRAEKRLHALELRAAGKSAEEVASVTGLHAAYISQMTAKLPERRHRSDIGESLRREPSKYDAGRRNGHIRAISGKSQRGADDGSS